jgi:hypothetical protein
MGNFFSEGKQDEPCSRWQAWLDAEGQDALSGQSVQQWASALASEDRAHLHECDECRVALEAWLSFRQSVQSSKPAAAAPPWFAARVMAAIAAREEESRPIAAWIAVPRFAARLAWVCAAALVFAGTWLYEKPLVRHAAPSATANEGLFDTQPPSVSEDEVLVAEHNHD